MKRPLFALVLAGLCLLLPARSVQAQTAAPAVSCPPAAADSGDVAQRPAPDRGFLWRIVLHDRVSYLYGTLHVAKRAWTVPGPVVQDALQASDVVALEMDLQDAGLARRMEQLVAGAPRYRLPPLLAKRLQRQLDRQCVAPDLSERLPPEFVVSLLSAMSARREGLFMEFGIDMAIGAQAQQMGKPVLSLETPESQLGLLLAQTPADAVAKVASGLDSLESSSLSSLNARLGTMWSESRFDELERYREWCDCTRLARDRAWLEQLLDERNPALAQRIDELHRGGSSVFAAVGALHMAGAKGLPALMKRRGYRVERIDWTLSTRNQVRRLLMPGTSSGH